MRSAPRIVALVATAVAVVGCGSTVQPTQYRSGSELGLGNQSATTGAAGAFAPGGTATAGGVGAAGPGGVPAAANPAQAALTTGSSGSAAQQGTSGGASASTGPLVVGILVTKCGNCDLLGPGVGQTAHSEQDIWSAMVKAVNGRGGILGRKVQPIWGTVDTAQSDWNTMFQSVCASFTQDHKVAVVLGASFVENEPFARCLAARGVPWFNGVPTVGDNGDTEMLTRYPYLLPSVPSDNVVQLLAYTSAIQDGWLKPTTRLGVLRSGCASDVRVWNDTVLPFLRSHNIPVADDELGPCTNGAKDQGAAASFAQSAELHMRANNVDAVAAFGIPLVLFAENAESQHWHPKYLTSGGAAAAEGLVPADQLANVHAAGWMPWEDLDAGQLPPLGPPQKRCLAEIRSGGLSPASNELFIVLSVCGDEWLYEQALAQTQGATAASAVMAGIGALGTRSVNPLVMGNGTTYTPTKHTGPVSYRSQLYNPKCSCFQYVGPTRPLPQG